jgi:hypothetical protein
MEVAAIDRELGVLQSELESLQGGADSKRFLGASREDFYNAMMGKADANGWVVSSTTDGGIFGFGETTTYTVSSRSNRRLNVQINRSSAQIYFHGTWDTFSSVGAFKDAFTANL